MNELKTYTVKIRQFNGHYDCTVTDESSNKDVVSTSIRLASPEGDLSDTDQRRFVLDCFFDALKYVLRQRTFPKDTLIYDVVDDKFGRRQTNPRYPSDDVDGR